MMHRLPAIAGEWIDRDQRISFTFEGTHYTGFAGDTITSALWAAGQRVLGRSFKYHRPRGVLSLANHDINALMQDGQRLNLRADVTPLAAGMSLAAINTYGGVVGDRAGILNGFSAFFPVGFYYKAFLDKPLFPFWERVIRNMTGLGVLDVATPHLRTAKRYDFCDVLVIGAGPSGLAAAIGAARYGADVVLVDENCRLGGSGQYQIGADLTRITAMQQLIQDVEQHPQIRIYANTTAAGYYADRWVPLVEPDLLTKLRAKTVIMANGAYEQPAVFRNNDLPGVMLASAAQRLIYRYAVKPMQRAIALVANRDGYRAAFDLANHGVAVMAIVDLRSTPAPDLLETAATYQIPVLAQHCVYEAKRNPAGDGLCSAVVCPLDADGNPDRDRQQTIACDGIVMSVGWAPAANLLYQAGAKMRFDEHLQQFVPEQLPAGVLACGRVNGVFEFEKKLVDGQRAGMEAAAYLGLREPPDIEVTPERESPSSAWAIVPHPKGKNFVDFDEDLQLKDFDNAAQEGFDTIELLKRYTTVGMGPSQGKHSNLNALRILARLTDKSAAEVGTTTARPFFHPVPMSHLAGRGFSPERQTPLHSQHQALGAQFMLAGVWRRPEYYAQPGKTREECLRSEVQTVRSRVGLIDVGTLGKFELYGPDAAEFLERVYTGRFKSLKVGMTRYAVMLDEAGIMIDDGVVARLGHDRFYFTTTTSGAATVYRELTRLNTIWQLDCGIVNVTGARSAINLAGPYSREVLAQLSDIDLSSDAFPYLAVRETTIAGVAAIVMRVGFVGEWGYEIHAPAEWASTLWDALLTAGQPHQIAPFGVEAQRLLRLEKGHLIVGQDTDGLTTPFAANLSWAVKFDKPFFIGQRSLQIARSPQHQLVGFQLDSQFQGAPPQECHLVIDAGEIAGRVTSVAFSPTLNRYIGLAYLKPELAVGDRFTIRVANGDLITATVSPTPFYDPQNLRQTESVLGVTTP